MFGLLLELNRGVPNGTLRGVRGRGNPPYSILIYYLSSSVRSKATCEAIIRPAADGTKAVEPGTDLAFALTDCIS